MRIFVGQLNPTIGAIQENCQQIIQAIAIAKQSGAELAVFAEMAICGYNPEDLLLQSGFIDEIEKGLQAIIQASSGISVIVGTVRKSHTVPGKAFHNSAAVIIDGQLVGFQDKCLLPTYDVFDEWRYFEPAKSERIWQIGQNRIAITICEDIWPAFDQFCQTRYLDNPLDCFQGKNLTLAVNISASPYALGKIKRRKEVAKQVAKLLGCPMLIVNQVGANDSLLYDGTSLLVDPTGETLFQAKSFAVDLAVAAVRENNRVENGMPAGEELFKALSMGIKDYFTKLGFSKAILGLSGGIDSAVVACLAADALGSDAVLGVLLPTEFTSQESRADALQLAANLHLKTIEIPLNKLVDGCEAALKNQIPNASNGLVHENLQSRLRAVLLMALSNSMGSLVLNTGNKSEVATGYTTLYGDAVGSIAPLGDLLKRQVYEVARYINRESPVIPEQILTKEPTAELRPNQKDSDTLPPYPILDTIVEEYVVENLTGLEIASKHGIDRKTVDEVIAKIHANEYKRRQLPPSFRVSDKSFAVGRRVPIVHRY